jgi:hypothetical protein
LNFAGEFNYFISDVHPFIRGEEAEEADGGSKDNAITQQRLQP